MSVPAPGLSRVTAPKQMLQGGLSTSLVWALIIWLISEGFSSVGISVADTDRLWWKVLQCPPLPVTGVLLQARHLQ